MLCCQVLLHLRVPLLMQIWGSHTGISSGYHAKNCACSGAPLPCPHLLCRPENVLLSSRWATDCDIKLIDFGLATRVQ